MVQPHLRALLFLADDAQEGGGGGPELNLSTSVKLELFRAVLETSGHALACCSRRRGRPAFWAGGPDTDALPDDGAPPVGRVHVGVHTNENHFLIALSRPRARTAPQAKPPPPNTTTRCGCSLGPSRPKRRRRSVARRCILEYGNMMRCLVDITKCRQVWEREKRERERERERVRDLERD